MKGKRTFMFNETRKLRYWNPTTECIKKPDQTTLEKSQSKKDLKRFAKKLGDSPEARLK